MSREKIFFLALLGGVGAVATALWVLAWVLTFTQGPGNIAGIIMMPGPMALAALMFKLVWEDEKI